jgi:hypothetical protein
MKLVIDVPDSLREISLHQYQKFTKLNVPENQGSTFLLQKQIEIFCNVNLRDLATIKYRDIEKITNHLNNIFDNSNTDLVERFKLGVVEYGFIPKLEDITLGEYIDLDNYLGDWDKMHKAMSVLYRPITTKIKDKYKIEEYDGTKYEEEMMYMPLDIAINAMVFFYQLNRDLLNLTQNYLKVPQNITDQQKEVLVRNGVGTNQSLHLLQEILKDLNISQS